nr:MAG TPA: hypothetical protein [Caudoviricetes sp.]
MLVINLPSVSSGPILSPLNCNRYLHSYSPPFTTRILAIRRAEAWRLLIY